MPSQRFGDKQSEEAHEEIEDAWEQRLTTVR